MSSSTLDLPINFAKCLWCLWRTWSKLEKCQGCKQSSKCNRTDRGNDVTNTDYLCLCKLQILGLLFVLFSYDLWTLALFRFINESCIFELIWWLMSCLILPSSITCQTLPGLEWQLRSLFSDIQGMGFKAHQSNPKIIGLKYCCYNEKNISYPNLEVTIFLFDLEVKPS